MNLPERQSRFVVYSEKEEVVYRAVIDVAYKMGGKALVDILGRYDSRRSFVPNLSPLIEHLETLEPGVTSDIFNRAYDFEEADTFDLKSDFIDPNGFGWVGKAATEIE